MIDAVVSVICYCIKVSSEEIYFRVCKGLLEILTDIYQRISSEALKEMSITLCKIMSSRVCTNLRPQLSYRPDGCQEEHCDSGPHFPPKT